MLGSRSGFKDVVASSNHRTTLSDHHYMYMRKRLSNILCGSWTEYSGQIPVHASDQVLLTRDELDGLSSKLLVFTSK